MPNPGGTVARLRESEALDADRYLRDECGAIHLSKAEYGPDLAEVFTDAWQIRIETRKQPRRLQVYIDNSFPFSFPKFLLLDRPAYLTWPHIEENGFLCLDEDNQIRRPDSPEGILGELLKQAFDLICESEMGTNQIDFQHEFYSYWNTQPGLSQTRLHSLLRTTPKSRFVRVWDGESAPVAGESERDVLTWLRNRFGDKPQFDRTERACLLWLPSPLLPAEYPLTPAAVMQCALRLPDGRKLLQKFVSKSRPPFYFILGANSMNGPCFAAVRSFAPRHVDIRGARRRDFQNGFRHGKMPVSIQIIRSFTTDGEMHRMAVERVDHIWVHGRGNDPAQEVLRNKRVIIAGCGSVGAPIAQYLAMAGVGNLRLIDSDDLRWANVGRHPLGAKYVGKKKSLALASLLQENYPHLDIKGLDGTLENSLDPIIEAEGCDLIVSAIAEWPSERTLNIRHVAGEIARSVLYAWTEKHASAGHAVLFPVQSASCLQCGFDLAGHNKFPVTDWPSDSPAVISEPACGARFQPYGPVELLGTISVASSLCLDSLLRDFQAAIHRIWAGPRSRLEHAGGSWSALWRNIYPQHEAGAVQEDRSWLKDPSCPVCGMSRNLLSSTLALPARG